MDKLIALIKKFNAWDYIAYRMVGLERYPVTKQMACWFYLDTKAVHPDILINARPLYIEEVMNSFKRKKVFN